MVSQLSLFTATEQWQVNGRMTWEETPRMSAAMLQLWKQRIIDFQSQVRFVPTPQQTSLMDVGLELNCMGDTVGVDRRDPALIHPFTLPQQNINFWQYPVQEAGVAALYFVIDYEVSLLLYVGETVKANQRWKGVHDCKRYLANYRQVHYEHQLPTALGIGFWCHAPQATRARQRMESALITQWRSPFNKENWEFWGTPFVGGKLEPS